MPLPQEILNLSSYTPKPRWLLYKHSMTSLAKPSKTDLEESETLSRRRACEAGGHWYWWRERSLDRGCGYVPRDICLHCPGSGWGGGDRECEWSRVGRRFEERYLRWCYMILICSWQDRLKTSTQGNWGWGKLQAGGVLLLLTLHRYPWADRDHYGSNGTMKKIDGVIPRLYIQLTVSRMWCWPEIVVSHK